MRFTDGSFTASTLKTDSELVTRNAKFDGLSRHSVFEEFRTFNRWS